MIYADKVTTANAGKYAPTIQGRAVPRPRWYALTAARHGNDTGSKSTKVQRNVFDLQKGFRFYISTSALDAKRDQRRFNVEHLKLKILKVR